jgi:type VI protein secretion system component VasK
MSPLALWSIVALLVIPIVALAVYSVVDVTRRDDIGGGTKAAWILAVAFVPLVGGLLYLIFRPTRPDDIRGFGPGRRQQQKVEQLLGSKDGVVPEEDDAV